MIFATVSLCIVLLFLPTSIGLAAESGLDTAKIESITGLKGVLNEKENTFKVSKPRNDVAITVDQARLAPFMGFTSWAAFTPGSKDSVMVMGDMVLFEDEVNPVMSVALDKGLEVPHCITISFSTSRRFTSCTSAVRAPWISWPKVCAQSLIR